MAEPYNIIESATEVVTLILVMNAYVSPAAVSGTNAEIIPSTTVGATLVVVSLLTSASCRRALSGHKCWECLEE